MKPQFTKGIAFGLALLTPGLIFSMGISAQSQASAVPKAGQEQSAPAKDSEPFPQVPRITAEEVQRLAKDEGKVVRVKPTRRIQRQPASCCAVRGTDGSSTCGRGNRGVTHRDCASRLIRSASRRERGL